MGKIEITCLSSKGQVVIPQELRERLQLHSGEKFVVLGEDDTIILKKLEVPSFKGFEKLLKKTQEFTKKKSLKEKDIEQSIQNIRKKKT